MKEKKYQYKYAASRHQMYDKASRKLRAKRILMTLGNYLGKDKLSKLSVLDVGSSTGIIDYELAKSFGGVTGIDIDKDGVKYANKNFKRKNLKFCVDDAMNLAFKDKSFDVVICAQVYEHVPDPQTLMNEIYRVLKPEGVCYFAALNRLWPMEPHYDLLFLSWLPKALGNMYVRLTGKSDMYYESLKSYWGLKNLTKKFDTKDYTAKILSNPKKFAYENELPTNGLKSYIISAASPILKYLTSTFFWLLIKPQ